MDSVERKNNVQLYLERHVDEVSLAAAIGELLGGCLSPIDSDGNKSDGTYWLHRYELGFPLAIDVFWRSTMQPRLDGLQLAAAISKQFDLRVATDLPDNDHRSKVPFLWCVAYPNGKLFLVREDEIWTSANGLVLDEKTASLFIEESRQPGLP